MFTEIRAWKIVPLTIVILAVLLAACGNDDGNATATSPAAGAATAATSADGISVSSAWARAAVGPMASGSPMATDASPMPGHNMGTPMAGMGNGGGTNSAAFMVIQNDSDTEQRLISAASSVAEVVEIHETTMTDGTMRMRPVEGGVVVPAHGSVELKPRGLHVMLIGLKQPLNAGDTIALTLTFESGATIELNAVEVRQP
ncbi:MAG TPA: copper chaperone PCu(A)C [Thermomicrobiales bacterium]|jgi:copper(I)-binding protein|nr:copper chaperone PCu(A)C [Chloroflexota bacterium]HQX63597.1 copper chaperone PCu(A)C [Thermomicrobiales bacterium]HBY46078.1 copper chaperone PCu(A)C [Chloroflexota bacterium]HCG28426.1 copper chaperone PCu(A)C [Chloroflexota bacterium]HQZ90051.1 copper chaperone PCu(A)C [Thermomicrobiales bacterium]